MGSFDQTNECKKYDQTTVLMPILKLCYNICACLFIKFQVAFGMDLDLLETDAHFSKAIDTCLKGLVNSLRDFFFEVILQFIHAQRPYHIS